MENQTETTSIGGSNQKMRITASGIQLFNRKNGFNILLDEVEVAPAFWAQAPRQVSIALTNICDLSCAFCYAPKNRASLNAATVIAWIRELDANGCLGIGFGGSEPTLYRKFPALCKWVTEQTQLAVTFTTHAHRIDERLAAQLEGYVHFIRVSMDGVAATYENLRNRPFGTLQKHLRIVRQLAPFGINFIVNSRTFPELDCAIQLAAEFGAREFLLLPEQPVRAGGGIDEATLQALGDWIPAYAGPLQLAIQALAKYQILSTKYCSQKHKNRRKAVYGFDIWLIVIY